jgi:hypothetical protein
MFRGPNTFYHQCVRKTVIAFGSLFNNIYVGGDRPESPPARIPLTYAPKQKWLRRLAESRAAQGQTFSMTLPRLGFALTNWEYDSTRKRTTMTRKVLQSGTTSEDKKMQFRFAEVPYNLTFELYIMPDTMDNGLRIVEQILPYFTPSYTVSINFNDLDKKIDIPITLSSVGWEDDYEGSFDTVRTMMYTLQFEAKSYLMGPINETKVILETQWSAHEFDDLGKPRAETRDFLRVWDRAVPEGATGTPPELADNSTNFEVWQDHELFADIDESWEAE